MCPAKWTKGERHHAHRNRRDRQRMLDATFLVNTPDLSRRRLYRGANGREYSRWEGWVDDGRSEPRHTGPKSGEGLEKVRSGDELFMQSFERLAAGPHPSSTASYPHNSRNE